jgi:hypothetical protein
MRHLLTSLLLVAVSTPAWAQNPSPQTSTTFLPRAATVNLAGPRFGFTSLPPGAVDKLKERNIVLTNPFISQFGWQFEKQYYSRGSGATVVSEWVGLLGGLDQGVALPSFSWLVGVRSAGGAEFGIGPNVTPAGVGLVVTAGVTLRTAFVNVPLNIAVVPSRVGTRVTVLTGFTMRRD